MEDILLLGIKRKQIARSSVYPMAYNDTPFDPIIDHISADLQFFGKSFDGHFVGWSLTNVVFVADPLNHGNGKRFPC